jgi:hypothetical protein
MLFSDRTTGLTPEETLFDSGPGDENSYIALKSVRPGSGLTLPPINFI